MYKYVLVVQGVTYLAIEYGLPEDLSWWARHGHPTHHTTPKLANKALTESLHGRQAKPCSTGVRTDRDWPYSGLVIG
jgi:hypothetical protein